MPLEPTPDPESLGSAARGGARWQAAAQAAEALAMTGLIVYLAQIVAPSTFGLVALATAVTMLLVTVLALPVTRAVIAHGLTEQRALDTAWWTALVPSFLVAILAVGVAAAVGVSGRDLVAVAAIAASGPLFGGSTLVQAVLQQKLRFRQVAIGRIAGALGSVAVAVALGSGGFGFAALLSRSIVPPLLVVAIGLGQLRWRPRVTLDRATLALIRGYAWGLAGFSLLNQFNRQADNLLVGGFLGTAALGYYSMAYRIIEAPVNQVGSVAQSVVFPTIVRIQDEARFREALLRSQKVLVWVVAPVSVCAIALGDVLVETVLGPEWEGAATIVRIFGAIALMQTANAQAGVIYLARDATKLLLRWALVSTPVIVGSFAIGLLGGAEGIAWAYLGANLILFHPGWSIPGRLIGLGPGMVLRSLRVELGLGFGLALAAIALREVVLIDSLASVAVATVVLSGLSWGGMLALDRGLRAEVRLLLGLRGI